MGAIRVVAPDGQVGEIPEEQAAGAFAAGFKPAPDAPAMPAMATPGAVPVRPTAPEPMVSVLAPDGQAGEVPQSQLAGALSAGFTRPPQEAPGGAAAALAEGIAQGASLGSQTPLAAVEGAGAWLGNKAFELTQPDAPKIPIGQSYQEAQRSITQREDEHPIASGIGQTIGIIAPALATSGASLAGTAVVGGATGLLARGATAVAAKVAAKVSATAARGLLAPATRLLAQGAIEGAAFGAAKEVDDAFIAGDYDSLAEKVAWSTARGVGIGAGMSLAGGALFASAAKVVNAAISGGRKLAEESAYKAVVGRTNQAAMKLANRQGGAEAVGRTLLDEGTEAAPLLSSPAKQFAALSAKADEVGHNLGELAKSADALGGGAPSRSQIWNAVVEKDLMPLQENPFSRDILESAKGKLAGFRELMMGHSDDAITFSEVRSLRMKLDETLRYDSAGPPTPVTQVMRNVRNTIEGAWLEQAEQAATNVGQPGFAAKVVALKQRYAHLALARDQAEAAAITQAANRSISLSDYLTGAGSAGLGGAAGGPVGVAAGIAGAVAHKLARERGRGVVALTLDRMAAGAVTAQLALNKSASLQGILSGTGQAVRQGITLEGVGAFMESADPASPMQQQFQQQIEELRNEDPLLADAMQAQHARMVDFAISKIPPLPAPNPFGQQRPRDPETMQQAARYVEAANDPFSAVSRVSDGTSTREDIQTLKAVYPRIYAELQRKAMALLLDSQKPLTYDQRLRISRVLSVDTEEPGHAAWLQQLASNTRPAPKEQPNRPPPRSSARSYHANGDSYTTRAERVGQ